MSTPDDAERWLNLLASEPRPAGVWRAVLDASVHTPPLASELTPLCWDRATLQFDDLLEPMVAFMQVVHARSSREDRRRIEDAVLTVAPPESDHSYEAALARERFARFLYAVDENHMVNRRFRDFRAQAVHPRPRRQRAGVASMGPPYDYKRYYGVDDSDISQVRLWELTVALTEFNSDHLNSAPDPQATQSILSTAEQVRSLLRDSAAMPDRLVAYVNNELATTAERFSRAPQLPIEALQFARHVLLEAASDPLPDAVDGDEDERSPTVIPQGARARAAEGLPRLAALIPGGDQDLIAAVQTLVADPVLYIRLRLVRGVAALAHEAPAIVWSILDRRVVEETSHLVLGEIVETAADLYPLDAGAALRVVEQALRRAGPDSGRGTVLYSCAHHVSDLWVLHGTTATRMLLDSVIRAGRPPAKALEAPLHGLRVGGALVTDRDEIRQRTLAVFNEFAAITAEAADGLYQLDDAASEEMVQMVKAGVGLAHDIAAQLYFATKAKESDGPTPAQKLRLWHESRETVTLLATIAVPRVTHYLVQFLEELLDLDPAEVLVGLSTVLEGARKGGYERESLAADKVVGILIRALADHRAALHDPEVLAAVRKTLELLVEAGWPEAHRLVYGLEDIFR